MLIDKKTVEYAANLSRIQLDNEQTLTMQNELGKILDYMEILKNVDTEGVEPLSHVFSITNVTRADIVGQHFDKKALLLNAPDSSDGFFVVPKAVD